MQVLLTGGSGRLGKALIQSGLFPDLLAPSSVELNICEPESVKAFFAGKKITVVIHAAAQARLVKAELNPSESILKNMTGTSNIVSQVLEEAARGNNIRFIHISSDGVYAGTDGNYPEEGPAIPKTRYGWSKLGAECAVNMLKTNFCIIRTRFFDPSEIAFDTAATDLYTSKIPVAELVTHIKRLAESDFTGTVNIGSVRKSDYEVFKPFKTDIRECSRTDIAGEVPFEVPCDISMNITRFQHLMNSLIIP